MIAAVFLLSLAGYFAARGLLAEDNGLSAAGLGTALGWCGFITALNLLLRAGVPFDSASPLALGLLLALGGTGLWRLWRSGRGRASLDRVDLALVLACAAPASLLIVLYQFLGPDSDNFIHYPLVALFLKGQFPHFNPYFPDIPLYGHYGRDLGLAGLLHFGPLGIGSAMAVEAWVLHMATLINVYFLGRRAGAGPASGLLAAAFAYFAVNAGFAGWVVRSGLAEVMGNNNPSLHAFLFAILLLAQILVNRPAPPAALLLGLLLGGFDHVYETHFHVTVVGLVLLAALCSVPRLRPPEWRRATGLLAFSVGLGIMVMLVSGGLTARMVLARAQAFVGAAGPPSGPAAERDAYAFALAGAQQKVALGFPKRPFLSLTHALDGRPVPLLGREFLAGQGLGFWLLPVSTVVLFWRRRPLGLACALMSVISILVPACVDFGRFNGENFRYIFLSGLLAAICAGLILGEAYAAAEASAGWNGIRRIGAIAALAGLLYASSDVFRQRGSYAWMMVRFYPQSFYLSEAERLDRFCSQYSVADRLATEFLAREGALGDRLASNYAAPYEHGSVDLPNNAMVIMAGAQMPMVGFNARIMRQGAGIQTSVSGWSGRAIAFWATGDPEILKDLGADWLYVVSDWLRPGVAQELAQLPALRQSFQSQEGGRRVVYRVDRTVLGSRPNPARSHLDGLAFASLEGLDGGAPEKFALLRGTLRVSGPLPVAERVYVHYRIRDLTAGADYDPADGVGTVRTLHLSSHDPQPIEFPFVFPYNPGEYLVTFYADVADGEMPIGEFRFKLQEAAR